MPPILPELFGGQHPDPSTTLVRVTDTLTLDLPPGYTARRPDVSADVDAIFELAVACDIAGIGRADVTRTEVADWLVEPRFDVSLDSWIVEDAQGVAVAWTWVLDKTDSAECDVDVYVRPAHEVLFPPLFAEVARRAAELVAAAGHDAAILDKGTHRGDERMRAALAADGWAVATTFLRMRIDLGAPPEPVAAPGVTIRRVAGRDAEDDLRAVHRVWLDSFSEHYGHAPSPYEEWFAVRDGRSDTDWSQLWVAEIDEKPVGFLLGNDQFVESDDAGYVPTLAVLPSARGRGIAKALLATQFAESWRRGHKAVLLHVDGANSTGAHKLYEAVGMRAVLEIDAWRKTVPVAADSGR
jgi:ribosomal protein S18 acetylase RimI-like enzyme